MKKLNLILAFVIVILALQACDRIPVDYAGVGAPEDAPDYTQSANAD